MLKRFNYVLKSQRRNYSELKGSQPTKARFDRTLVKPSIVLIVFGSVLINFMDQQKKTTELERRYSLKINILKDLVHRVKENNEVDIDIKEELKLVNKLFNRTTIGEQPILDEDTAKIRILTEQEQLSESYVRDSLNHKYNEDSLEILFKNIMNDLNKEPNECKNDQLYISEKEIVTNKIVLAAEVEQEKKNCTYKPETSQHIIVDNPGDYTASAEETTIPKFL